MFSVIILTHNKAVYTRKCLESLLRSRGDAFEVVVVDNGSEDETPAVLDDLKPAFRAAGSELRVLTNDSNVGCCTGRNQGLAEARGEFLVFMDNDVMVCTEDWPALMRECFQRHPDAGIVGPKLIYPFEPHLIQCAGVAISPGGRVQFRGRGQQRDDPRFCEEEEVQCLISASFVFRRRLYEELGGLDEAFNPIEYEDLDYCYRARQAGYKCFYAPGVEFFHWESITSEGTQKLPNTYLIIKHGMLFKERWRHMFSKENGPPESECQWRRIPVPSLEGRRTR